MRLHPGVGGVVPSCIPSEVSCLFLMTSGGVKIQVDGLSPVATKLLRIVEGHQSIAYKNVLKVIAMMFK